MSQENGNKEVKVFATNPTKKSNGDSYYTTPNVAGIIQTASRDISLVKEIVIPGDLKGQDKVCLWEMGGGGKERGLTMLVGGPDGKIIERPHFFRQSPKPNARQALASIWEGCTFAIGSIDQGRKFVMVFEIIQLFKDEQYPENPMVKAKLVASYLANWVGTSLEGDPKYMDIIDAALDKLDIYDCQYAIYMNDWAFAKRKEDLTIKIYNAVNLDTLHTTEVEEFDDIDKCMWEVKKEASKHLKKFSYTPVRQILKKEEDGTYTMYAIVINSPENPKLVDDSLEQDFEVQKIYKVSGITPETDCIPKNPITFFRIEDCSKLDKIFKNNTMIDNWLRYIGC